MLYDSQHENFLFSLFGKRLQSEQTATPEPRLIVLSCGRVISELLVLITLHYHRIPLRGPCPLQGAVGDSLDNHNVELIRCKDIEGTAHTHDIYWIFTF